MNLTISQCIYYIFHNVKKSHKTNFALLTLFTEKRLLSQCWGVIKKNQDITKSQKILALILSTSEGLKADSTMHPPMEAATRDAL